MSQPKLSNTSNETPRARSARTKWALSLLAVTAVVLAALLFWDIRQSNGTLLRIGDRAYVLEVARTTAEQQKGLGGRSHLKRTAGMLFVFGRHQEQCFWMKDTQFPLDIIWLDGSKRVTAIEHRVAPESYPDQFCHDGRYVIELASGEAKSAGVQVGQTLDF